MFLAQQEIFEKVEQGEIKIDPFVPEHLGAVAYDLELHTSFRVFRNSVTHVDVKEPHEATKLVTVEEGGPFVIHPGQFLLASTAEKVTLPENILGILEGRSSLGRLGLIVHATASFINPGSSGHITFEVSNLSTLPVRVYAGMRVAQLAFAQLSSSVAKGYGEMGKYQHQDPPTPSRIWKDFE